MTKPVTGRALLPAGRKAKQPPRDAAKRIEDYAADGCSVLGIAKRLGTSPEVLNRWMDEDQALRAAFDTGRENERWALHNMLYRQAMDKGNSTAAMFLLKARHGYREGDQSESGNKVQINFQLPGAMTMDAFQTMKVLENGNANNRDEPVPAQRIVVTRTS